MTTSSSVMSVRDRADRFRSLHEGDDPLRLVNVWDLVSARVAELAGAPALATSSFAIAVAQGYPDGEHVPWPVVRDLVARIVDAVDVPVSVDIEAGRGAAPDTVAATVTDVVDGRRSGDQPGGLPPRPAGRVVHRRRAVRAPRSRASGRGMPTASIGTSTRACDVWFGAAVAPEEQLAEGRRSPCVATSTREPTASSSPDSSTSTTSDVMVDEAGVPVNVMLWPGVPPVAALHAAGVRRISQGAASFLVALGGLEQTTRSYLAAAAPAEPEPGAPMPAMHLVEPLTASRR